MSRDNRELLRRQLEQQARLFTEEQDQVKLAVQVLTTCSALLRATEKIMPDEISETEFRGIYAGYLGIANKVKGFYENPKVSLQEKESEAMEGFLNTIKAAEETKKVLDQKLEELRRQADAQQSSIERRQRQLSDYEKRQEELTEKKGELEQRLKNIRTGISALEEEIQSLKGKIERFEPEMENLVKHVEEARDTYQELVSYYDELERIQRGIREDGFVNMESFSGQLQAMNEEGDHLMIRYDQFLRKITADIENLQKKIDIRRKAGVIR